MHLVSSCGSGERGERTSALAGARILPIFWLCRIERRAHPLPTKAARAVNELQGEHLHASMGSSSCSSLDIRTGGVRRIYRTRSSHQFRVVLVSWRDVGYHLFLCGCIQQDTRCRRACMCLQTITIPLLEYNHYVSFSISTTVHAVLGHFFFSSGLTAMGWIGVSFGLLAGFGCTQWPHSCLIDCPYCTAAHSCMLARLSCRARHFQLCSIAFLSCCLLPTKRSMPNVVPSVTLAFSVCCVAECLCIVVRCMVQRTIGSKKTARITERGTTRCLMIRSQPASLLFLIALNALPPLSLSLSQIPTSPVMVVGA